MMIKIVFLLFLTLNVYAKSEQNSHAVVFMYHHFGVDKYPSTNIRIDQFQKQLDYLQENHYNVWPLSKIVLFIKNKIPLPEKTVALTIDDAYISVYTTAFKMLKSKGFPFTVFVNTNPVGKNSLQYMTWEQMREMKEYGAEFSNHSDTHPYLMPKRYESFSKWKYFIEDEIERAQKKLQKELGNDTNEHPRMISYPFGEYTQKTAKLISSLGYVGVSQTSGVVSERSDMRALPRFAMSEKFANMDDFILKLNSLDLPLEYAKPWDPMVKMNPPTLDIKLKKELKNFSCYTADGNPITMQKLTPKHFRVQAKKPLAPPRNRYTCTAISENGEEWYWYSHLWILKK